MVNKSLCAMIRFSLFCLIPLLIACSSDDLTSQEEMVTLTEENSTTDEEQIPPIDDDPTAYFPSVTGDAWETVSAESLEWNLENLGALEDFLQDSDTKAFIILKDGRIAFERYFQDTDATTYHRWNSAAKTLTATTVGIAQEEGFLNVNNATANYLGQGWTSMTSEQELNITIRHQLTMTTGGEFMVNNLNCTLSECLRYYTDPSTNWYYHNAFYILLQDVVSEAVTNQFDDYFNEKIATPIGLDGYWQRLGFARLYYSTTRSTARFGLLVERDGLWEDEQIIPKDFLEEMTSPTQELNAAYGFLWWLNGQESFKLPSSNYTFSGTLIPSAPSDLIAGLGKDDQKLYVVPSQDLVIVRLGGSGNYQIPGPRGYDTELWEKLNAVLY